MGKLKKFETFSDSVVVEALKVMIIAVVEAGFPCIPVILESEGRGGTYLREVFLFDIMAKGKGTYQTTGTYSRKYGLWKIIIFVNFELRD